MRYLFFDIECCDGAHMCEFGYVLADGNFEVTERECLLMAPEHPFNLSNRVGEKYINLHFTEEQYNASPTFPHYYEKIKGILEAKGQTIIGFSTANDFRFLRTACKYYGLAPYQFSYYDSQTIYATLYNCGARTSLEKAAEGMGIPLDVTLHKSDDDAALTYELTKAMCKDYEMSFEKLYAGYLKEKNKPKTYLEDVHYTLGDLLKDKGFDFSDIDN